MSDYFTEIKDVLKETHPEHVGVPVDISDVVEKTRVRHELDAPVMPKSTKETDNDSPNFGRRRALTGLGIAAAAALVFGPNVIHSINDKAIDSQQSIETIDQSKLSHIDNISEITILVDGANIRSEPVVKDMETPGFNILEQLPAGTVLETKDGVYKYADEFDANSAWIGFRTDDKNDKDHIAWVAEKNVELTPTS